MTTIGTGAKRGLFVVLAAAACAACARRVSPATSTEISASGPLGAIVLEAKHLDTRHIANFAEVQRTLSRGAAGDTSERESVRTTVEERLVPLAGARGGLLQISTGHYASGDFVDTLLMQRDGLLPLSERIRYPQRRWAKQIEFHGTILHQVNHFGDSTHSIDRQFSRPVFAFSEVDLVIRSLPFAAGYRAILPLYSEGDDSLEMDTVAVTRAPGRAWTVRFADPAIIATYVIDSTTRRITQYDVTSRLNGVRARRAMSAPDSR